ncbi:hypothetical protein JCM19046_3524 [Bacillus sp. JCM 19046]|nr:hypothetical protein JCM19045_4251 [Bacillus sp. JCM 19045]GAF18913.1 hypothetical protein JCM19046_3524 [Bacillus sp. JCM 19046]
MKKEMEVVKKLSGKIKKYVEIKDDYMINDTLEVVSDSVGVITLVKGLHGMIVKRRFNAFLKGLSNEELITNKQLAKLEGYIDNEAKAEYVADSFTKVITSNSTKACMIMGAILHDSLSEDKIDHKKLICMSALANFYDADIANFIAIDDWISKESKLRNLYIRKPLREKVDIDTLNKYLNSNNLDKESVRLTLEKCVSSQLVLKTYDVDIEVNYDEDFGADVDNNHVDNYCELSPLES